MPEENMIDEPLALGVMAESGETLGSVDEEALEDLLARKTGADGVPPEVLQAKQKSHLGTVDSVRKPSELSQAGWAVLWGAKAGPEIQKALSPLIEHRKAKAGSLFREFFGETGYLPGKDGEPGDTAATWLARKNVDMGDVNPRKGVPYYVLIVAPPDDIPFEFQYGLDLNWAVGRIWFPEVEQFRQYAESVVAYENPANKVRTTRQIAMFAPSNGEDRAMGLLIDNLAKPMMVSTDAEPAFGEVDEFRPQPFIGESATGETLDAIMRGKITGGPPAILFTGSHGMVFESGDVRQDAEQGAIVCQEWKANTAPKRTHYFSGRNLDKEAEVHGMIHFLFNCYGAGWPRKDSYSRMKKVVRNVAPAPMLAMLPQMLLSHRNGGALAVIAHIDRAFASSYRSARGPRIDGIRSVFDRLTAGECVGHATDRMNQRWAALSIELAEELELADFADRKALRNKWIVRDDARNYIVFGDPAVKLRTEDMPVLKN